MSSRRVGLLAAVGLVLAGAAAPPARAQVCPFCIRAQLQLQVQMQQQRAFAHQTIRTAFQRPNFFQRQLLLPHPMLHPGGRSLTFQGPRVQFQRTTGTHPVTRTFEATRTQVHREYHRVEEHYHPHGPGTHPGPDWWRVREWSTKHVTVTHTRHQETHLEKFTRDRLTVRPPSVSVRQQPPARYLRTVPRQQETVARRGGETEQTRRVPVDTHRPSVQLRVRFTAVCGTCHAQPPAPTLAGRPAAPPSLLRSTPAAPSLARRTAPPAVAAKRPAPPSVVSPQPLFPAAVMPDLLAGLVRPPRPALGPAPAARLALLAPPALPPLMGGLPRPEAAPARPEFVTRAPGERSSGETGTPSPGDDLLRGAAALPPLEGSLVLARGPDSAARPAPKAAEVPLPLPEELAEGPPLPPLPARPPLLIDPPADVGRPAPARPAAADALALAPALPPLPDEPPAAPTLRE